MTKEQARKDAWAKFCPPKDNPCPPTVTEHLAFIQGFEAGVKYAEKKRQTKAEWYAANFTPLP